MYLHELGHAIGLVHEHQLPERDEYITINLANVQSDMKDWYQKYSPEEINNYGVPYEYSSVMHYGLSDFARDKYIQTIFINDKTREHEIGQVWKKKLAFTDIKVVNLMYKCNKHCAANPRCKDPGYLDRWCRCVCPPEVDCTKEEQNDRKGGGWGISTECRNSWNKETECKDWAERGECEINPAWMKENCRKSCGNCPTNCSNIWPDSDCNRWAKSGECSSNKDWMKKNCKESCGVCRTVGNVTDLTNTTWNMFGDELNATSDDDTPDQFTDLIDDRTPLTASSSLASSVNNTIVTTKTGNCANIWPDRDCTKWAERGECVLNKHWMAKNCARSCHVCHSDCSNIYQEEKCNNWAHCGECSDNQEWMEKYCKKSCEVCLTDCINIWPDGNCSRWASLGECSSNYNWMEKNCRQSCNACNQNCSNTWSDTDCYKWADRGECTINKKWMETNCFKSCGGCSSGCSNIWPDMNCNKWADNGECTANKNWMDKNCKESCGTCKTDNSTFVKTTNSEYNSSLEDNSTLDGSGSISPDHSTGIIIGEYSGDAEDLVEEDVFIGENFLIRVDPLTKLNRSVPVFTTNCSNIWPDADCKKWANLGECSANKQWMGKNCKESCKKCSQNCTNLWPDADCDSWAKRGECDTNAKWMEINCSKSCAACSQDCSNIWPDTDCNKWADRGECSVNNDWMVKNCKQCCKSCNTDCSNIWPDADCTKWADRGECSLNNEWMQKNCKKSCKACDTDCSNISPDSDCNQWAQRGECTVNKNWMEKNCKRSCQVCSSECFNIWPDSDCKIWSEKNECTKNKNWMQINCRLSCEACSLDCLNVWNDTSCNQWADRGECKNNKHWMEKNCKQSCQICVTATTRINTTIIVSEYNSSGVIKDNSTFENKESDQDFSGDEEIVNDQNLDQKLSISPNSVFPRQAVKSGYKQLSAVKILSKTSTTSTTLPTNFPNSSSPFTKIVKILPSSVNISLSSLLRSRLPNVTKVISSPLVTTLSPGSAISPTASPPVKSTSTTTEPLKTLFKTTLSVMMSTSSPIASTSKLKPPFTTTSIIPSSASTPLLKLTSTGRTTVACHNRWPNRDCDKWAKHNHCQINPSWMRKHCSRSCNSC